MKWNDVLIVAGVLAVAIPQAHAAKSFVTSHEESQTPDTHAPMDETVFRIPVEDGTPLEATLLVPHGAKKPLPLAIVSGGASGVSEDARGKRDRYDYLSGYFLARGYAVLRPMPRGFGGSGGHIITGGCDLASVGWSDAQDIRTVIQTVLEQRSELDGTRIVTAGISFGGWVQMAFGTTPLPGMKAQLLFYPLMHESDCHDDGQSLVEGARVFGERSELPTLWIQGENDSKAPTDVWQAMFAAYHDGNDKAELLDIKKFGNDSHAMLLDAHGLKPWQDKADALLARVGLPSQVVDPRYLPPGSTNPDKPKAASAGKSTK
ncbi:dienelactone hydrolase [Acetobacter estunensis NRIC 0472]|uniref:Xaa-Pro dipeptidyl-peptidase-like domain-containing protein n=1 Tax=Acetobacter estunensis TaxID=104097 RepID=A0A967B7T4_9PROT|nr:CocE/NonD family hydrolase [Acetobacter estunensis]NHO53756.1 hypothetical protein [Acetobacter estunensis]GBQ20149.1 dienelactone hydrolase [Acetobacter estunensis NRIC 0472]